MYLSPTQDCHALPRNQKAERAPVARDRGVDLRQGFEHGERSEASRHFLCQQAPGRSARQSGGELLRRRNRTSYDVREGRLGNPRRPSAFLGSCCGAGRPHRWFIGRRTWQRGRLSIARSGLVAQRQSSRLLSGVLEVRGLSGPPLSRTVTKEQRECLIYSRFDSRTRSSTVRAPAS